MKRFVAVTLSGILFTGFALGISMAQDGENLFFEREERQEESRDREAHRQEL